MELQLEGSMVRGGEVVWWPADLAKISMELEKVGWYGKNFCSWRLVLEQVVCRL